MSADRAPRIVFVTAPTTDVAAGLARALVSERLAACGNLVPGLRSIYAWKGEICDEPEVLLLLKTTADRVDALAARLAALHPYEVPEVVAVPIDAGLPAYLAWIGENVGQDDESAASD